MNLATNASNQGAAANGEAIAVAIGAPRGCRR